MSRRNLEIRRNAEPQEEALRCLVLSRCNVTVVAPRAVPFAIGIGDKSDDISDADMRNNLGKGTGRGDMHGVAGGHAESAVPVRFRDGVAAPQMRTLDRSAAFVNDARLYPSLSLQRRTVNRYGECAAKRQGRDAEA